MLESGSGCFGKDWRGGGAKYKKTVINIVQAPEGEKLLVLPRLPGAASEAMQPSSA
jgi:hypothetical protein